DRESGRARAGGEGPASCGGAARGAGGTPRALQGASRACSRGRPGANSGRVSVQRGGTPRDGGGTHGSADTPILIGPARVIEHVARESEIDVGGLRIVDTADSRAAAEQAMALAGEVEMLVQGSLGSDELL